MKPLKKAAFIDRDGTINVEVDRLTNANDFVLIDGAAEAIKQLNDADYLTIVITNQSVIGRKMISDDELQNIHRQLNNELKKHDASIDAFYYCPHTPEDNCNCRKPKTGMIDKAVKDYSINLNQSFFVGDNLKDMQLAQNVGIKGYLVRTGYGTKVEQQIDKKTVTVCDSLLNAVQYILKNQTEK